MVDWCRPFSRGINKPMTRRARSRLDLDWRSSEHRDRMRTVGVRHRPRQLRRRFDESIRRNRSRPRTCRRSGIPRVPLGRRHVDGLSLLKPKDRVLPSYFQHDGPGADSIYARHDRGRESTGSVSKHSAYSVAFLAGFPRGGTNPERRDPLS
jgi:hypothetical protein